jgi:hypothetical protein
VETPGFFVEFAQKIGLLHKKHALNFIAYFSAARPKNFNYEAGQAGKLTPADRKLAGKTNDEIQTRIHLARWILASCELARQDHDPRI